MLPDSEARRCSSVLAMHEAWCSLWHRAESRILPGSRPQAACGAPSADDLLIEPDLLQRPSVEELQCRARLVKIPQAMNTSLGVQHSIQTPQRHTLPRQRLNTNRQCAFRPSAGWTRGLA